MTRYMFNRTRECYAVVQYLSVVVQSIMASSWDTLRYYKYSSYAARSAKQIQNWLNKCTDKHLDGCTKPGSSTLPKRLILLDNRRNGERLIEVKQLQDTYPKYLALSYRWGEKNFFETLSSNLSKMESRIPHNQLPRTIKDVFHIARLLNFQYVWIDSLCIVQKSDEWKTEAAKMGDVYANAALVIAAMASRSVYDGLFVKHKALSQKEKDEFHYIMRTCRTMTQKQWHERIKRFYPLLCRGWAFQERLLARRIVHFTVMELIWECNEDRWCECGNEAQSISLSGKINNLNSALRVTRRDADPEKTRLMWRECVKSFSKRDLTQLDDRLFAISGIASYIRGPNTDAYVNLYHHGLWADALPWDLLWYCDPTSDFESTKSSRSPSYSWASVDCGIEWPSCNHWLPEEKFSMAISTGTCIEFRSKSNERSTGARICVVDKIENDSLTITSRMTPVRVIAEKEAEHQQNSLKCSWLVQNTNSDGLQTLPFYPDIKLDAEILSKSVPYYYVEIVGMEEESTARQAGLIIRRILEANNDQPIRYERVGMAGELSCNHIVGSSLGWLRGEENQTIVLI